MWQDEKKGDISLKEVLDFLRTSYRVNEAVEGSPVRVDWHSLSSNSLLAKLKEREQNEDQLDNSSFDDEGKIRRCNSLDMGKKRNSIDGSSRQSSIEKNSERLISEKRVGDNRRIVPRRRNSVTPKKESNEPGGKAAERYIKRKLNQVLQEGILDSVLPYILSRQQLSSKKAEPSPPAAVSNDTVPDPMKICSTVADKSAGKKDVRRKSTSSTESKKIEKDPEVVIHVCDEVKNMKKDFRCSQSLLVTRMKYFSEVTAGQRLEDMDISVHCDVSIFDWLIRWVKQEGSPTLDTSIVIPVLMSSAFLQMDSLQELCLEFCKAHINEVIRDSTNLSCINDSVLSRLANLFSNVEVEGLKDRKDKMQSKLYCKLIMFLAESSPQTNRGHFYSIAYLFKCSKCGKLVSQQLSMQTRCVSRQIEMNNGGQLISKHLRDPAWSLSELVRQLKTELKTWRKVYWRLWGMSHHLFCSLCAAPFPLYHMSWCCHHAEPPQFFAMEHQRTMTFPVGRYPCCGDRAFRFEVIPTHSGCLQKDHSPEIRNELDGAILKIFKEHRDLIRIEPSEEQEKVRVLTNRDSIWWEGMELAPLKTKQGLLGSWLDPILKANEKRTALPYFGGSGDIRSVRSIQQAVSIPQDGSSYSDCSDSESSDSCGESEESYHATVRVTAKPRGSSNANLLPTRKDGGQIWIPKLSTRCNQDNQREFEERAVRHMEKILTRKTCGDGLNLGMRSSHLYHPPGGIYVRLEAEWREAHCTSHGCPGSSKARLTTTAATLKNKIKR